MKIGEVLDFVDKIKPNAFGEGEKILWLNEVEGIVQTEVLLYAASAVYTYCESYSVTMTGASFPNDHTLELPLPLRVCVGGTLTIRGLETYGENNLSELVVTSVGANGCRLGFPEGTFSAVGKEGDTGEAELCFDCRSVELIAPNTFHKLYYAYLMAMIDFANGEYNKYKNTMTLFNSFLNSFMRWYAQNYRPADGESPEKGYCVTAYSLAVKHGFSGSESDFLDSLRGENGADGASIQSIYRTAGNGTSGTTDTYTVLMSDGRRDTFHVYNGKDGAPGKDGSSAVGLSEAEIITVWNSVFE